MTTNCGQKIRFTRQHDELSSGDVTRTDEKSASATGSWTATNTVKKYREDARLPTQETQLSLSKGSSHIHSSKHSYSWESEETSRNVPSQQRQQENLRQSVPSHPTGPSSQKNPQNLRQLLGNPHRVGLRVRRSDGGLMESSDAPRHSCPPGGALPFGRCLQASVVGVIGLVVHDQLVVHKVEAVWSGLVRVADHLVDWKKRKHQHFWLLSIIQTIIVIGCPPL